MWTITLLILGYAFLMSLFKVTKFQPKPEWKDSLTAIFKVGLPVAIFEEAIFRNGFFYLLLTQKLGLSFEYAMMLTSLFFASVHFDLWWLNSAINWFGKTFLNKDLEARIGGMHRNANHKIELFIGLFFFSMVTCAAFDPAGANFIAKNLYNIIFHSMAIYGVSMTAMLFTKEDEEKHGWLWDEGHQLLRSPIMWSVLGYYFCMAMGWC